MENYRIRVANYSSSPRPMLVFEIRGPNYVFPRLRPSMVLEQWEEATAIAAAPSMVKALQGLLKPHGCFCEDPDFHTQACSDAQYALEEATKPFVEEEHYGQDDEGRKKREQG